MTEEQKYRAGCSIGAGIGGLPGIASESIVLHEKGPSRVSPHFVHGRLINLITGQVQIKYGLMGPNHAGRHGMLDRRAFDRRCRGG